MMSMIGPTRINMNYRNLLLLTGTLSALGLAVLAATGAATTTSTSATTRPAEKKTTPSGLTIVYTQPGEPGAKPNDIVYVLYTGKFQDGTIFDSTALQGGEPYEFVLGKQMRIIGWAEGLAEMRI